MAGSIGWGWNVLHGWPLLGALQDVAHATHMGWRMKCLAWLMPTCKWQGLPTVIPNRFFFENHLNIHYYIWEPLAIVFHHQSNNIYWTLSSFCNGFLSDWSMPQSLQGGSFGIGNGGIPWHFYHWTATVFLAHFAWQNAKGRRTNTGWGCIWMFWRQYIPPNTSHIITWLQQRDRLVMILLL
jgi:hypothetical protein